MPCKAAIHDQENGLNCEELVIDIQPDLGPAEWPKECCIYRVPKKLRKVNKEAYTPKLISIGPFHHRQEYWDMEKLKKRYLRDFCERTGKSQKDLASIVKEKEGEIRRSYAETLKPESIELLKIILLDGIFIIELFRRNSEKDREKDYILSKPWLSDGIQHDLLLLENQLPYFVLEDLYVSGAEGQKEIKKQKEDDPKKKLKDEFLKLCRDYFSKYDRHPDSDIFEGKKIKHLTDLLRCFFYPPQMEEEVKKGKKKAIDRQRCAKEVEKKEKKTIDRLCCAKEVEKKEKKTIDRLCSATKLDETGVKFKKVEGKPLLDIQFQKDWCLDHCPCLNSSWLLNCLPCFICLEHMQPFLELPAFEVGHETECVFRNIMALEQCHYPKEAYVCNYIQLLDCLINTEKDVDLLVEEKVIVNQLGSDEAVARLVNKLGHQIVAEDSCYCDLSQNLNEHYEGFWNRNMATLTTTYFRDIWRGSATVVGIIFLLLTFWNIFLRHFVKMPHSGPD